MHFNLLQNFNAFIPCIRYYTEFQRKHVSRCVWVLTRIFSCKQIPILNRKKKTIVHHTFVHCDFLQNINELVQNIKYYAGLEKNTFPAA